MKIGVTGEPGVGKTTFCNLFKKCQNVGIINCDEISKKILFSAKHKEKLKEIFGKDLTKDEIAKIIFSNLEKKIELENFIHPLVWQEVDKIIAKSDKQIYLIESAIIYETHSEKLFDKIILITCNDKKVYQKRFKDQNRLKFQLPSKIKQKLASMVIDTSSF